MLGGQEFDLVIDSGVAAGGGRGVLRQLTWEPGGGTPIIVLGEKIGSSTIAFLCRAAAVVTKSAGFAFRVRGEVDAVLRAD